MGESYLQRKVFSKIRAAGGRKRQASNNLDSSSSSRVTMQVANTSSSSDQSGTRLKGRTSSVALAAGQLSTSESANAGLSSSSIVHLSELARNQSLESFASTCSSSVCSTSLNGLNGSRQQSSPAEVVGENSSSSKQRYSQRIRNASRAIFFLRRAGSNRRRRPETLQTGEPSQESAGSSEQQQQQQQQVPQLIVPKMNTLKLPLVCLIRSLDGELMREVFVHPYEVGQYLIESLKVSVGISDCKYFGLKLAKSHEDQEDLRNLWLDLNESVCKQIKNCYHSKKHRHHFNGLRSSSANSNGSSSFTSAAAASTAPAARSSSPRSIDFYLRIKFYPPNLARVQDQFLRNYLWLQLRRDLRLGKLTSSMNNLTLLMACVLQYELGDFRAELSERIPELSILPNQDLIEEQAILIWSTRLAGQKRHQAQMQFLRAAVILETYGFDYYPVRDHQRQRAYLLGFNYAGLKTIRNGRIVHHFSWHSISKISYERRMIIFHIYPTENSKVSSSRN